MLDTKLHINTQRVIERSMESCIKGDDKGPQKDHKSKNGKDDPTRKLKEKKRKINVSKSQRTRRISRRTVYKWIFETVNRAVLTNWSRQYELTRSRVRFSSISSSWKNSVYVIRRTTTFEFWSCQSYRKLSDWTLLSGSSHLALTSLHAKSCSCPSFYNVEILDPKRLCTRIWQQTKIKYMTKIILYFLDASGKSMVIESRKVNYRRSLMTVTEMTDSGRWN